MSFKVGATYSTFADFDRAFREFQVRNNVLFVTKATKTVAVVNDRLSAGLERLRTELKYANATYVCKHGGNARTTGTGIRPQQRTMKKLCPAAVVVAARRSSQLLEITKMELNHNHEVSQDVFKTYPESRRLTTNERDYVQPLVELNVLPSMIVEKLNEKTGKKVITKDVHNLKQSIHGGSEVDQLLQEIQQCREKFHAKVIPATDENQELQILLVQTHHMQEAFKSFPEVLLLDATYRTNKLRMPLFVFVVQDGTGGSQVVAYAFVASEQQHVVSQLLGIFVKENPDAAKTKVVIVDKDFTEINAIKSAFSSSPAVQLCEFHVVKAFRTAAGQLSKSAEERERIMASFTEMLHAPTVSQFEDAKLEFQRFASPPVLEYFNKNWNNIPDMWVRHLCDREFTGGNNTTNRVESHNAKIKNVLSSSAKLHEALQRLLNMADSMRQEASHKIMLLKTCNFYSYNRTEEVEHLCAKVLTPYACGLISEQLVKTKVNNPEVKQASPQEYTVASGTSDTLHSVSLERQTCSCTTFSKMGLLCRHFLAVILKHGVQPDLERAVHKRWFKSFQLDFLASSSHPSNSDGDGSQDLEILSVARPPLAKMNRNQRYNYALRTLKALADNLADCQPDVFARRLSFLEDVNTSWLRSEEVTRASSTEDDSHVDDLAECDPSYGDPHPSALQYDSGKGDPQTNNNTEVGLSTDLNPGRPSIQDNGPSCSIKLPMVRSRGRPPKRILQSQKRKTDWSQDQPVPFKQLSESSQQKMLLNAIASEAVCRRVLSGECCLEECDVEVRPELLPSSLLDYRVSLPKIKKFFTPDAWLLLISSIAAKKTEDIWFCALCREKDDGTLKMISCDQCLEWFHWSCADVNKEVTRRHWFCPVCMRPT